MDRAHARVLVVGVGGLGCPLALILARAGVGALVLADDDVVERTNLHRQILFDDADVGCPKLDVARRALSRFAPAAKVSSVPSRVVPENALDLVSGFDLVVEGSDNYPTKFLVADACRLMSVPVVHGAAVRWVGTALSVGRLGAPCYRCLFEDLPDGGGPNCAEAGVVGPVVGVVASLQADLALRFLDRGEGSGELVTFDGRTDALRRRNVASRPDCPLCGKGSERIGTIDADRYAPQVIC